MSKNVAATLDLNPETRSQIGAWDADGFADEYGDRRIIPLFQPDPKCGDRCSCHRIIRYVVMAGMAGSGWVYFMGLESAVKIFARLVVSCIVAVTIGAGYMILEPRL